MECKLKNITVYYETFGEGRPFIALHGSTFIDHRWMVNDLEPIFEHRHGWKRIYPDLPFHGRTPGADWITTPDQVLDIVLEFIDQVARDEHFLMAGLSYGAFLARGVIYRKATSVDGLLLTVPQIYPDYSGKVTVRPPRVILREDEEFSKALGPEEKWVANYVVAQSRTFIDRLRTDLFDAGRLYDGSFDRVGRTDYSFEVDAPDKPFDKPSLIMMGRQDNMVGYRDAWGLIENFPRATFALLDRAGHFMTIEQERLFRVLVNEWLDRVEESTS